jgi:hypothetical protein
MSQEEYTQFIEFYRKFNKKLDHICHIGFDKDLSYFDSAVIDDDVIELRIEHNKQTQFIDLIEVIPVEMLKYTDEEIKKYFIDKETELTNVKIKHYKESIRMAEDNISKMEKIKSLSDEISNEIIKAKHSVILRKSLIEEAEKRLNQYITHVNNF